MGSIQNRIEISEKNFESLVKQAAKLNGWLYYHTYRSKHSEPGFPDCVMVRPPRLIFAELKSEKGRLTPDQVDWLETIRQLTGLESLAGDRPFVEVYLWRPSDWEEIEEVLKREAQ